MATQIQIRRGTAATWTASNPVLAAGEIGFETDTNKGKFGNGTTAWNSLSYAITGAAGTVTSITAGTGLSGGTITSTGTIAIDSTVTTYSGSGTFTNKTFDTAGTGNSFSINGTAITSNTGTGANVLASSPSLTTPKITLTYSAKTSAYTFASGDEGNVFSMNAGTAQQFNIPTDATFNFAIGTQFNVFWVTGAGQPTIGAVTPGTTTVISTGATSATPKLRVANSMATVLKIAANSWIVIGDIS